MKKISKKCLCLSIIIVIVGSMLLNLASCKNNDDPDLPVVVDPVDDNYRTFYQVFVGSFSDGNSDGIGDLRGVINRMDYLNDGNINSGESLGVQGIWLSPIFASPSYHKYDTTDYYKIDWRFGTEEDLKELADICEERNVKLILDLVINHTSKSHPWFTEFQKARQNGDTENKYYDYYTAVTYDEQKSGSTYSKIAGIDCYYECNFSGDMPELNFDNPAVREEVLNIAKYYIELGIDGFRFDAVKYIYYNETDKSVDFWEWYMSELKKLDPEIYCVGECWSGESDILKYYTAMNCFNFAMATAEGVAANAARGNSINNFLGYVPSFQKKVLDVDPNAMPMSFLSNHDMDRIAGAFVTENNTKMAANLYLLSPGSPMIYYGEEIGIRGSRGSANTDANRRLAMLWGDEDPVRDPVGTTYSKNNQIKTTVKDQLADANSILNHYKKLIAIRNRHPEIARGIYSAVYGTDKRNGGFLVEYDGSTILIFHNIGTEEAVIDLSLLSSLSGFTPSALADVIGCNGATLDGTVLTLGGQTSVIIK